MPKLAPRWSRRALLACGVGAVLWAARSPAQPPARADTTVTATDSLAVDSLVRAPAPLVADTLVGEPAAIAIDSLLPNTPAPVAADSLAPDGAAPGAGDSLRSESPGLLLRTQSSVGVNLRFEDLIDRRQAREMGRRVTVGANRNVPGPLLGDDDPGGVVDQVYSPLLGAVVELGGPGYFRAPTDYYVVDGTYYTYDPVDYTDPTLRVRAVPFAVHQQLRIDDEVRRLYVGRREAKLAEEKRGGLLSGEGITVTAPFQMPSGALSEIFGRGATSIKVTGRENISFGGESRKVTPFVSGEQGRGQSLFPRLDMQQELQVKLDGTIGDKVHVQVDHNSAGFGVDANRINIYYEGYEDDIVRRIDLGGTNLALPGSGLVSFSGGHSGLFGIKSTLRFGGLDLTMIASKEEAEVETRTVTPGGSSSRPVAIAENRYERDRFYFYEIPDVTGTQFYESWGIDPALLLEDSETANLRVFRDNQRGDSIERRRFRGFAVAGLQSDNFTGAQAEFDILTPAERDVAVWPPNFDPNADPTTGGAGAWEEIDRDDLGFVTVKQGGRTLILGFYLRSGAFGRDDALGVLVDLPGRFGALSPASEGGDPQVRLRLVRHPEQEGSVDFNRFPTAPLMMRHVYSLGTSSITNLELKIARAQPGGSQSPDVPPNVPVTTYLHMFGLDDYDTSNNRVPDNIFDIQNDDLIDLDAGLLFMPGVRPFSPPDSKIIERLISAGVPAGDAQANFEALFGAEVVDEALYTLPATDSRIPSLVYNVETVTTGTQADITLPLDAIEGTEVVRLDGTALQRGVDYDVDPIGGRIVLKGQALDRLLPGSRIEVSYQFRPLFGGGKSTLLGVSGEYQLGTRGKLASVLLYESTGFADRRSPKLGEEPTRTLVADVNGTLRFQPNWMTRLTNLLPFADAGAASSINLSAEVAASMPNPNTRNDAFIDDLEGADDSEDQNLSRDIWAWASQPIDSPFRATAASPDTLRVPLAYYNPPGRSVRAGHLNPTLGERERDNGITVLELGFDRAGFAHRDTLSANLNARDFLWSGVMRSFGVSGIDLTRTKSVEFWINDKIGDPTRRNGRMHIDFGTMSEDFVYEVSPLTVGSRRFNREAVQRESFQASEDDLGWDLQPAGCVNLSETDAARLPFGSECFRPSVVNSHGQHFLANGTEGNEGRYDTEDVNGNGIFDEDNSYFGLTIDLASPEFIVTDVTPQYADDPTIPTELKLGFEGWRRYRIELTDSLPTFNDPAEAPPSLRRITSLRLWFEDTPGTPPDSSLFNRNIQIYGLRLNRNQWLDNGFFAADGTSLPPDSLAVGELFDVGVISNKDDPEYELVPNDIEIDEQGSQARRQSLRINFENIQPGHEILAERILAAGGVGLDFTPYRRLAYWVHYPRSATAVADTAEFFFRVGSDTLNYYEVAQRVPAGGGWQRVVVTLQQLTDLKFPEDVPGAVVDTLFRAGRPQVQVRAPAVDALLGNIPLRLTRRGDPTLQRVLRLFVGIRNPSPTGVAIGLPAGTGRPASGEAWFDNVRLEEVEREVGLAQTYSVQARFSDVFDIATTFVQRDSEFRSLRQRTGSNSNSVSWDARAGLSDLGRIIPTFGLTIPMSYQYRWDRSLPKFFQNSDTRNTPERQTEQRTEGVRHAYNFSVAKRPSRFWFNKISLDRLQFTYSEAHDLRRAFLSRDTTTTRSRSLSYDLSPRERTVPLWGRTRLNLLPTNLKFAVQHSNGRSTSYNVVRVAGEDSLVRRPVSVSQSMSVTASTALRPLSMVQMRYQFSEPRTFRQAHPINEAERLRLFGYDLGLPGNRTENIGFDFTPRPVRFGLTLGFGDSRVQQIAQDGRPLPDLHNSSATRSARVSFDFALHRRVVNWVTRRRGREGEPPPPAEPQETPPPIRGDTDAPPPDFVDPLDDAGGAPPPPPLPPRRDYAPQEPHEDSLFVPPIVLPPGAAVSADTLDVPSPGDTLWVPSEGDTLIVPGDSDSLFVPADADSLPPGVAPPETPQVPIPRPTTVAPGANPVPPDTTRAKRRRPPSPIDIARGMVRAVTGIEAIKVEYENSITTAFANLPDAPSGAFRYGFSRQSGLLGSRRFVIAPTQSDNQVLSLGTGIPLTRNLRIATRFKIDERVGTTRSFAPVGEGGIEDVSNTNEDHRVDITFPSFDFTINGIERMPLFRTRLQTSSMQFNYVQGINRSYRLDQARGGPQVEAVGRNETDRTAITASWNGQWKRGVSSTFSANQTNSNTDSPGTRRESVSRSFTAGVRFKLNPAGGLPFPFVAGGLKGGMDISLNTSYSTEDALRINQGTRPLVENNLSTITLGARSDYTLSRNMSGAAELGYTRQARDDIQEQTVHTVRVGLNLTFLF